MSVDVSDVRDFYEKRAREAESDLEAVDQSERSQRARICNFFEAVGYRTFRGRESKGDVLDVGCGAGDLYGHLGDYTMDPDENRYLGVDLSKSMVARAKKKWGSPKLFRVDNILDWPDESTHDFVAAIGIHGVQSSHASALLDAMLAKQFALCRVASYSNFLSVHYKGERKDYNLFWYPEYVLSRALKITSNIRLDHTYLSHDFSVVMFK